MVRTPFLLGVVLVSALLMSFIVGCVTVPSSGPTPPNYTAQVRIISLDPALAPAVISYANGPFTAGVVPTYNDLTVGNLGVALDYTTFPAGGKKLFVKGVDADTSAVSFNTDMRGTMYILPRKDVKADSRFFVASERYTFAAAAGIPDTTRIRFFNAIASFDTVQIWRTYYGADPTTPNVDAISTSLRFQKSTSVDKVPAGQARKYYVKNVSGTTALGDTVFVTGATFTDLYVMLYDSLSVLKVVTFQAN